MRSSSSAERRRRLRSRRRLGAGRDGQAMVEFVLSMPFLLLIFVAVLEITRLLSVYSVITEVSGDVARFWTRLDNQALTGAEIETLVNDNLSNNGIDLAAVSVVTSQSGSDVDSNAFWSIRVSYQIQPVAPLEFFGYTVLDPAFTISANGSYAVERTF